MELTFQMSSITATPTSRSPSFSGEASIQEISIFQSAATVHSQTTLQVHTLSEYRARYPAVSGEPNADKARDFWFDAFTDSQALKTISVGAGGGTVSFVNERIWLQAETLERESETLALQ